MKSKRQSKQPGREPAHEYCVRLHGPHGSLDISVDPNQQEQIWWADLLHHLHGYSTSVTDLDSGRLVQHAGAASASGGSR